MINKDKLLEEEHLDATIESLLEKITEVIIAFKLSNQDSEEAATINKISSRLEQFKNMYKNESKLFEQDKFTEDIQRKKIETKLIEDLGIIINYLDKYKDEINRMIEKLRHNQNINHEYEVILGVHSNYKKKSEKVANYIHALE